ncbi:MAG: apolipoprotein N-acyltransferase [Candidatus Tenebribacter burtonii]|jgi:apolipoprotein N-acyltransferase|nr:apolipoprotein N-acyltransferase [Candidatus Tenebribacter burtonii]
MKNKLVSIRAKTKLKTYLFPALAGTLLGLSRLPIHLGFLVFFAFIPLFYFFSEQRKKKEIFLAAAAFGSAYTLVCLHWISLVTFPGYLGIFFLFAVYFYIVFQLYYFIKVQNQRFGYLGFIFVWISFEFLQNFGEFSFPWFNLGYSLADYLPFIQLAEFGGLALFSLLILFINILLFELRENFRRNTIILSAIIVVWSAYGVIRLKTIHLTKTDFNVSIVQVSIPQDKKWEELYKDSTFALYEKFSHKAAKEKTDLIIWPESSTPVYLLKQMEYRKWILDFSEELDTDIFTGFPHYKYIGKNHPDKYKFYNSATLIGKNRKIYPPYYKNILVPFGERIPFLKYFPFLWNVHLGQANWEYGEKLEYYSINEYKFSPLICFEIAFPQLTTEMAKNDVDFIVNITNDAWFKRSAGTYQHAVMTKFRAVETRKQIYRAANTGYSLVVSPTGELLKKTTLFEKTTINNSLYIYKNNSYFTKYFFWFPFVFVIGAGIILVYSIIIYLINRKKKL